ncbi:MAG: outer membrane protein assembly factor BamE [Pirellulaceae bacterium]|nr:outer membrane protein assembly factor BamE [Pirellulaceae bacterium]
MCRRTALTFVFGLLVLAVIVVTWGVYVVAGPVVPRSQLRQLKQGMSKSEVRAILGNPETAEEDQQWVYSRWGNPGWVEVHFDAEGRFDRVNSETIMVIFSSHGNQVSSRGRTVSLRRSSRTS